MPLGIIIYNFADIFGMPWEVVAKSFREQVHDTRFATLQDVCKAFCEFIQSPLFMTTESQEQDAMLICLDLLGKLSPSGSRGARNFNKLLESRMNTFLVHNKAGDGKLSMQDFRRRFGSMADMLCDTQEQPHAITKANRRLFSECARHFLCSDHPSDYFSGFAIFGFGEKELLPSVHHYLVDGAPLGSLRILSNSIAKIDTSFNQGAVMLAFAQKDAASLFMEGISPGLKRFFLRAMRTSLDGFSGKIFDEVKHLVKDPQEAAVAKSIIDKQIKEFSKGFSKEVDTYIHNMYVKPVVSSIDGLGKGDMANLARAMVELASIKKMVSRDIETVGGPIDVAVLSKSDGFVWINRKHYFNIEMNRAFYERYFTQRYQLGGDADEQG